MKEAKFFTNKVIVGVLFLAFGTCLGALGAHALEDILMSSQMRSYLTAVRYLLIHGVAILAIGLSRVKLSKIGKTGANLVALGTFLFSFSIFLLALRTEFGIESAAAVLGPITPIGGVLIIFGWFIFLVGYLKANKV